jgi:alkanesulfonate monooxygenase SsuD/methylene tetrahydromethanopterin reductase-like flavin-dependent oxidoreductase (luciferase family)
MAHLPFRFAVQATPQEGEQWLATARQADELGYSTLLMPDGMQLMSPLPALALAAGATT